MPGLFPPALHYKNCRSPALQTDRHFQVVKTSAGFGNSLNSLLPAPCLIAATFQSMAGCVVHQSIAARLLDTGLKRSVGIYRVSASAVGAAPTSPNMTGNDVARRDFDPNVGSGDRPLPELEISELEWPMLKRRVQPD